MRVKYDYTHFIDSKSAQICFYLQSFWRNELPHQELQFFFWDTIEEWHQVKPQSSTPYSRREQVFWHVLQQVHFWPEDDLKYNHYLCEELRNCIHYLLNEGLCPFDCIGLRP